MKSERMIRREIRLVERVKDMASKAGDREVEDWNYGAECALRWALGEDVMRPYLAFYPADEEAARRAERRR